MNLKDLSPIIQKVIDQYGEKFEVKVDADWFVFKLQEELGELVQAYLNQTGRNRRKPESAELSKQATAQELADVFCFTLLLANKLDIDLEQAVKDKWMKYLE